jgi:hypothetical protein
MNTNFGGAILESVLAASELTADEFPVPVGCLCCGSFKTLGNFEPKLRRD